jgi:hypothetical protein
MEPELTRAQAREIARLRRRHPRADVLVHHKPWGLIIELRLAGRTAAIGHIDRSGHTTPERRITARAAYRGLSPLRKGDRPRGSPWRTDRPQIAPFRREPFLKGSVPFR